METQEISFDQREEGRPIVFSGGADTVSEGSEVDLQHDGASISAKVLKSTEGDWLAEVTVIPGGYAEQFGSVKLGSKIRFQDRHIFRCAA